MLMIQGWIKVIFYFILNKGFLDQSELSICKTVKPDFIKQVSFFFMQPVFLPEELLSSQEDERTKTITESKATFFEYVCTYLFLYFNLLATY